MFNSDKTDIQEREKPRRRYMERRLHKHRIYGQLMSVMVFISAMFYLGWCVRYANWEKWYATIPFLAAEFVFLLLFLLWTKVLWNKRFHHPAGPPVKIPDLTVDVYVPTAGEPLEILERTLRAAMAIEYEQKKVYVLDDSWSDKVEALAERLGVNYLRRSERTYRKAGNLNHAFEHTDGDIILAIDADQVAKPNLLKNVLGYFSKPHVGFVQTEQHFEVPKGDPWGNTDRVFYRVMQPGKDYDNAAISCGNGALYRRAALDSIGGFSTWNLVEDVHTSMKLHAAGWTSVYHRAAYTKGSAPRDVRTHIKQRWQWAVDSMRMFFWDNPLFQKGLTLNQKLQYLHFGFNYLAFGVFLPVFFLLPTWSLFTHEFMLTRSVGEYFLVRTPYLFFYMLSNKLTTDKEHNFKVFQAQAGLFATYFSSVVVALFSRNKAPRYTVTSKVVLRDHPHARVYACLPHILISVAAAAAIIYGLLTIHNDFWFLSVNVAWALWTIAVLSRFIVLALSPQWFEKIR